MQISPRNNFALQVQSNQLVETDLRQPGLAPFARQENAMRSTYWLITAILALLLTSCAGITTAPTPQERQALAPTGKLRVGLQLGSPHNVIRDSGSGEMKGVGFDLGKELARRLGVPFEPVLYSAVGSLLEGGKSGAWNVAFVEFSPTRAKKWDFTALHLEVEFGYLVPEGSSIATIADVDQPGVRIAVQQNSQPAIFLSRTLKTAMMVEASSLACQLEGLKSGKADAIFSIKPSLFEVANNCRVLGFSTAGPAPIHTPWRCRRDGILAWHTRASSLRTRSPRGW